MPSLRCLRVWTKQTGGRISTESRASTSEGPAAPRSPKRCFQHSKAARELGQDLCRRRSPDVVGFLDGTEREDEEVGGVCGKPHRRGQQPSPARAQPSHDFHDEDKWFESMDWVVSTGHKARCCTTNDGEATV